MKIFTSVLYINRESCVCNCAYFFVITYLFVSLLQVLASWKLMGSANSKVSLGIRVSLAALAIYAVTVAVTANLLAHCTGKGDDYFIVTVCNRPMFGMMNTALLDQSQESLRYESDTDTAEPQVLLKFAIIVIKLGS